MQGFNMGRYYPPHAVNPPTFNHTSHPLGKRASKISQGILIVRFELPFAVWCNHCSPEAIVGQGVRFNAEKKKVGNYHSTPIWSFRMKHSACGGWWEIRTDPQKSEYTIVEGARRREYGPEHTGSETDGELKFLTNEEREKRREDAFANLEGKMQDKDNERMNRERLKDIYDKSESWRDPYEVNARLRRNFRVKRHMWKKEAKHKEGMQSKFSLGIDIADETDTDRMRAGLVDFATNTSGEETLETASWKPLFADKEVVTNPLKRLPTDKKVPSDIAAETSKKNLQRTLVGNSRALVDPFSAQTSFTPPKISLGLLKRKRDVVSEEASESGSESVPLTNGGASISPAKKSVVIPGLTGYDSD